ncbi:MAG: hypothetical protein EBV03_06145 [Proteobacteria bacterium]|nr:hypothetical protein [Pseudomonadota bacterium]
MPFFHLKMAPMFVLHVALFWLALALIAMRLRRDGLALLGWLVLLMGLLPPLTRILVCVYKDVGMAVAFLLAFALAFWFRAQQKKIPLPVGVVIGVLLFYGLMVRHNAYFAGAPLIIYLLRPQLAERPLRYAGAMVALVLLTLAVSYVVNYHLIKAKETRMMTAAQVYDLTGVGYYSDDADVLEGTLTLEQLKDCYTPNSVDTFMFPKCNAVWRSAYDGRMHRRWLNSILKHPMGYLTHRIMAFNEAMYFIVPRNNDSARVYAPYMFKYQPYHMLVGPRQLPYQVAISIPVLSPGFALATGLALLVVFYPRAGQRRDAYHEAMLGLLLSGVIYMAAYFIVGVSASRRYDYWSLLAIYIAVLMAVPRLSWRGPRTRAGWVCAALLVAMYCVMLGAYLFLGDALMQVPPVYGPQPNTLL